MKKQIFLSNEKKKQLEKDFKVCRTTVWAALTFYTNGGKAKLLRAAALQRGGVLLNCDGGSEPNLKFDTYFNEVPRQMIQVFSPRVRMVGDLEHGGITIEDDGEVAKSFGDVPISELYLVQAEAQEIVNTLKSIIG